MTPEDRTLDGAAVDEVARGGAAEASSGEAAPAEAAQAAEAPPAADENSYHKALDAYMNGDLSGVVKLVDEVLEQQPAAGLKSRLERLRRRATDRLTREKVDAPAEPEAVEAPAGEAATGSAATAEAAPAAATAEPEAAVAAPEPEAAVAAPEPEAAVAAPEAAVAAPEPEAAAPAVEAAPPADAITSEPPKTETVTAAATTEAAPAAEPPPAATPTKPDAQARADTPAPADRSPAPGKPARSARPAGAPAAAPVAGAPPVARPPSGAPAARPPISGKPVAAPVAGARPRQGSGSHPALNAPPGAGALKAELDRVAGELDRLRKVVSGVEEHIVKVAEAYGKLAKDGKRKDQAYDQLYEELRQYKDNFLRSAQKPLFLDVVLLFDGISRTINQFADLPDEKVTRQMVVDALSHTRDEILELLYRRDIEKISDAPKKLDVAIQKPVTRIETDNADEDRDIVSVVREGFRWSGVVLRAQEVVVKRSTKEREPQ